MLVTVSASSSWATKGTVRVTGTYTEGDQPFEIILVPSAMTDTAGQWRLTVWGLDLRRYSPLADYNIAVGPGSEILSGNASGQVDRTGSWHTALDMRRTGPDTVEIHASFRIRDPLGKTIDFYEQVLDIRFDGRQIVVVDNYYSHRYATRDGGRFRYGDQFLVAVADDEKEVPRRILTKPTLLYSPDIRCRSCGIEDSVVVSVAVTVGSNGVVTWLRPGAVDDSLVDPRIWAAIEKRVRLFRFSPAMSAYGPVADWAVLRVRVVPDQLRSSDPLLGK